MDGASIACGRNASGGTRERILALAGGEGFPLVRFAVADVIPPVRETALRRQADGLLDGLNWMTGEWLERATDPGRFLEGARTVVLLALPYRRGEPPPPSGHARGRIAAYAAGRDYHRVFEKKLRRLAKAIREEFGASARPTVDYGPLLERPLATAAGMGWRGKSTMLLVPGFGPWVLLGAIATSLAIPPDPPLQKSCGTCRRCLTACPTGALAADGSVVDARLCISYHTIENRGPIPRDLRPKFGAWIFGCDDCLESCPVGAHSTASHPDFVPRTPTDAQPELAPLLELTEEAFAERYRGRAIMRAKRDGFLRNVCIALGNVGTTGDLPALAAALEDGAPLVRGHAAWGAARLVRRLGIASALLRSVLEARLQSEEDAWVREELLAALGQLHGNP